MKITQTKQNLKLHKQQDEILILLYRYRFLTRIQIQSLLKYKNHSQTLIWLKFLIENKYINRYDEKKLITTPIEYSLGSASRKYLKSFSADFGIQLGLLDRVWREDTLSQQFRSHCIFLADIYLYLCQLTSSSNAKLYFFTKTDLFGIEHLILPNPDAYFAIEEAQGSVKRYFLDLFVDLPPSILRKRVRAYFDYFKSREWQNNNDKQFPDIILICPNYRLQKHLSLYIQSTLKGNSSLKFHLSCLETIKRKGLNRDSLQTVDIKD